MRKYFILLFTLISVGILSACGQTNANDTEMEDMSLEPIEVDLQAPQSVDVDEQVLYKAVVTQADELIEDAEVVFEVWEDGDKESSQMLDASNEGSGEYTIEHAFTAEGVYHVQSHVDARGLHTMPKAQIIAGNPDTSEIEQQDQNSDGNEHNHH